MKAEPCRSWRLVAGSESRFVSGFKQERQRPGEKPLPVGNNNLLLRKKQGGPRRVTTGGEGIGRKPFHTSIPTTMGNYDSAIATGKFGAGERTSR